jgi:hypothetical protein
MEPEVTTMHRHPLQRLAAIRARRFHLRSTHGLSMTKRHITDFDRKRISAALPKRPSARTIRRIEAAALRFCNDATAECHWEAAEVVERKDRRWLRLTKRPYPAKGRPRKEAVRRYLAEVAAIYKAATGRAIKRIVYSGSDPRIGRQKRHPFLVACLKAAGIPTYPTGLIRQVLEGQ